MHRDGMVTRLQEVAANLAVLFRLGPHLGIRVSAEERGTLDPNLNPFLRLVHLRQPLHRRSLRRRPFVRGGDRCGGRLAGAVRDDLKLLFIGAVVLPIRDDHRFFLVRHRQQAGRRKLLEATCHLASRLD